ncbi:hypothetical protein B0H19DRAFT_1243393 [Mycena capillaripes]|nr:hypothetical protein B0H19DRAFT_1243393 [Mycena capillaripes]
MLWGWNTTYVVQCCQFSAKSDGLMLSGAANDAGRQGEIINFLSPNRQFALYSTSSSSIHNFGGSFFSPDCWIPSAIVVYLRDVGGVVFAPAEDVCLRLRTEHEVGERKGFDINQARGVLMGKEDKRERKTVPEGKKATGKRQGKQLQKREATRESRDEAAEGGGAGRTLRAARTPAIVWSTKGAAAGDAQRLFALDSRGYIEEHLLRGKYSQHPYLPPHPPAPHRATHPSHALGRPGINFNASAARPQIPSSAALKAIVGRGQGGEVGRGIVAWAVLVHQYRDGAPGGVGCAAWPGARLGGTGAGVGVDRALPNGLDKQFYSSDARGPVKIRFGEWVDAVEFIPASVLSAEESDSD